MRCTTMWEKRKEERKKGRKEERRKTRTEMIKNARSMITMIQLGSCSNVFPDPIKNLFSGGIIEIFETI